VSSVPSAAALASGDPCAVWIGHATYAFRLGGQLVVTDPIWGSISGVPRLVPAGIPLGELPPLDIVLVTHDHRELSFSRIHPSLSRLLEERGETIAVFEPYRESGVEPVFYRADAFYIPFAGLDAVERGGPIVRIWKLQPR